jgi:beta-N-acetylhexosaminidase
LQNGAIVSLERLREVVGAPAHRAVAADIARRAITLLRDQRTLLPLADTAARLFVVQYAPETEIKAGRAFMATLRGRRATFARIGPSATKDLLDSLGRSADAATTVIVAAYVRRVEGEGRFAMPQQVAAWIDALAARKPVAVVAFGNPYLIRQFPRVGTYLVTYGVSDDLERAAVTALLGRAPITGKVPVSLPGFFRVGEGMQR